MTNKAIILAAGIGSRLRPITNSKPKCLVEVNGVPILGYMLKNLLQNNIDNITIVCGYKAELIKEFCYVNFPDKHFNFIYNKDYDTTNNLYSLFLAKEVFSEGSFLMNADIIFDESILSDMQGDYSCVAVDVGRYIEESMKVVVKNNTITGISKKIEETSYYGSSIDLYKFTELDAKKVIKKAEDIVTKGDLNEWTEIALNELFIAGEIDAKPLDIKKRKWFEIDNFEDLVEAELLFNSSISSISSISSLKQKKVFFVDYDGTLSIGGKFIKVAKNFLSSFPEDKTFYVLTNNSSKVEEDILYDMKVAGADVTNVKVLISTLPALTYLKENNIKKLYWVANEKVSNYIKEEGFIFDDTKPEAVLLCYDDTIDYQKIVKLTNFVRNDIPYYATHTDKVCPVEDGYVPDIGCYIDMIDAATEKRPIMTFGKPDANFVLPILKKLKLSPDDAVVIGDRLYTDIELGRNADILSVLVLSGETKRSDYEFSKIRADVVINDIDNLTEYIK